MDNKFLKNIKLISGKYGNELIAEKTGVSLKDLDEIILGNIEPSTKFLINLKQNFAINIEELLLSDMSEFFEADFSTIEKDRFTGNYMLYYFDNSRFRGEVHETIKELNYGVITVVRLGNKNKVYSLLTKSKREADTILNAINNDNFLDLTNISAVENKYNDLYDKYKDKCSKYVGNIELTDKNIFLKLTSEDKNEIAFAIFENPPSTNQYLGGLGTLNSVSRGNEHSPCIQYLMMWRHTIMMPTEFISSTLSMKKVELDLSSFTKDMIDLMCELNNEENILAKKLTKVQKESLIESTFKNKFEEILTANEFRFGKITTKDNNDIYYKLKGVSNKNGK